MKKKTVCILSCLLIALAAIPVYAEEEDRMFPVFLAGIVRRHGELKNLSMPNVEIHTTPEMPDEALYLLTFRTAADVKTFTAAIKEENVPYGTLSQNELQVALYYTDMMRFVFWDVMGLLE